MNRKEGSSMSQFEQFISKLNAKDIKVVTSSSKETAEKIAKKIGGNPDRLIQSFVDFKEQTGINKFSFVYEARQVLAWKKKGQPRVVLNFRLFVKQEELNNALNSLAEKIVMDKEPLINEIVQPKISQTSPSTPIVQPSKVKEALEEVFTGDLLVELGKGIKIFLSNASGVKVSREEIFLELIRNERRLYIESWIEREPFELTIGGKDYRLKQNTGTIVELGDESDFVNGRLLQREKKDREFCLKRGAAGEIIIDLRRIRGNKSLDRFLAFR